MSKAWKKRSPDEARASGGSSSKVKSSKSNSDDFEDEGTLIKKKTHTYQSHLKLRIVSLEAPPVNNVDFRAAGATKHSGNEVTGATGSPSLSKADKKQQKNRRQKDNHMQSHRPVSLVSIGEVKQMKIGPFPTAADLPANGLLFDDLEGVATGDVQKPENKSARDLIPAVVLKPKRKVPPKSVKFASDIEENWGSAPPNQQRVYSSL